MLILSGRCSRQFPRLGWGIAEYHRGIKQCCGVERVQVRNAAAIANHILMSIRAFIRLELYRIETGTSWYEAKIAIISDAVASYLVPDLFQCETDHMQGYDKKDVWDSYTEG